ncbi:polysaccharide deacetylase family protein [Demequina sp.]|uniref:polysaccharide deacetylase family protein n=1 Tax=Demequina sp. TaxID=2050685 RepID=UPI0025E4E6FA|nr:polysaccharide deacetylase family protein [Demequina sp.]
MRTAAPLTALAVLALAACSQSSTDASPTASAPGASSPPAVDFVAPELSTVDPTIIAGLDVQVDESLAEGHYTYEAVPVLPNAQDFTAIMREYIAPRLDRFREIEQSADGDTRPELTISWDIVAASPQVWGVRLTSAEVGGDAFDGDAETVWIDVAAREQRWVTDLFEPDALPELVSRIYDAGVSDPRMDQQLFNEQMDGELEAFDSVAFTTEGQLWVEFDRAQVSTSTTPIGVEVDPDGLLSDFGKLALEAALSPSDPAVPAIPQPSPSPVESTSAPASERQTQELEGDTDCGVEKCIALTFDDGPVAATNDLLDVLQDRGVKATFFMVGKNATANPAVVKRIAEDGHALGNHTWDHPQLTRLSASEVRKEIERTSDAIEAAAGVRPTLLRPPYGATNGTVADVAAELGMPQILWDVDPEDWKDKNSDTVRERVLGNAHRNAIVLSHDIHSTTRNAYAAIIDSLISDGYTLVTVPDLLDDLEPGKKYFNGK